MTDKQIITGLLKKYEISSFKWIKSYNIVVSQWVRFKCMYGCPSYGTNAICPPNVPSINECQRFFSEYSNILLLHFNVKLNNPEDRKDWCKKINLRLLELERELFLHGYYRAFLLFLDECRLCDECELTREKCKNKKSARPSPEGLVVDVFETVQRSGLPIKVLKTTKDEMDRYAFILLE